MPMVTEAEKTADLVGTKANPAREPRKRPANGRGSVGDQAFMDAVYIVAAAWLLLLLLWFSLKTHNV